MRYQALLIAAIIVIGAYTTQSSATPSDEKERAHTNARNDAVVQYTTGAPSLEATCEERMRERTGIGTLVRNLNTGETLVEEGGGVRWPIASLTKIITSVVAREQFAPEARIVIPPQAETLPNGEELKAGYEISLNDALEAMMVNSSNEVAYAVAAQYGEDKFLKEIEKKLDALKLFHTFIKESTGLSAENQSTVRDLAKLAEYVYKNASELFIISRQTSAEIIELTSRERIVIPNRNPAAEEPGFLGGKTGYIKVAKRNVINIMNVQGDPMLVVILGAEDPNEETKTLLRCAL